MDFVLDPIKDVVSDMIINMLVLIIGAIDTSTGQLDKTPSEWNPSIYHFIYEISSNVILPIGGMILTLIACYELIHMIIDKNNMTEVFAQDLFKWLFKTVISIIMLSNMFIFIESIFELAQSLLREVDVLSGTITTIPDLSTSVVEIVSSLEAMNLAELILLQLQLVLMWFGLWIVNTFILPLIVTARMFHIYIMLVFAPIPFSTFGNREWSNIGQNYVKSLCAIALQVILMQVCFMMYDILISTAITGGGSSGNALLDISKNFIYGILLVFMLWKTGAIAKSVLQAH